jgi:hypothetical protein
MRTPLRTVLILAASAGLPASGGAFTIEVDYSLDDAATGFFASTPAAKNAVNAAAADLSAAITTTLGAVTTDIFEGTNGITTATFDWDLHTRNPATGADLNLATFVLPANTVRIYVGMMPIGGSTIGQGAPAGAGFSLHGHGSQSQWSAALTAATNNSNAGMGRGGGPIINKLENTVTFGTLTSNYTTITGSLFGSVSIDNDINNDGVPDSAATLASFWHYNHTTAVSPLKDDLYSVALHEMLHTIGLGAGETWAGLHIGTTWTGSQAIALNGGTGVGLVTNDGHIASGIMSPRLVDGVMQEVVMDPSTSPGTRTKLTQMDLAFLRDIGWTTVPEPGSTLLLLGGVGMLFARRRRGR